MDELAIKLQEVTDRSFRNEGRIKKLEEEQESIRSLATSVAVMAEQMKTMNSSMASLTGKVEELEHKPGRLWEGMAEKAVWMLLSAGIAFLLAKMGL